MTSDAASGTQRFTLIDDVEVAGEVGQHHLIDFQTQELVSVLWATYLRRVRSVIAPGPAHPVLRSVSYSLHNEAFPGEPLRVGIRMVRRSRRSCTLAASVWHPDDGRTVHAAEMLTVFVDPSRGVAVEIPADFWAEVERLEGRPIPIPPVPLSRSS